MVSDKPGKLARPPRSEFVAHLWLSQYLTIQSIQSGPADVKVDTGIGMARRHR